MDNAVTRKLGDAEDTVNDIKIPMTRNLGLADLLKKSFAQVGPDHVSAFAGNLAYHALLAIFPFIIMMISTLALVGQGEQLTALLETVRSALPAEAYTLINDQIAAFVAQEGGTLVAGVVSALLALWGVSGAFRSLMESMNVMYGVVESRSFVKKYLTSIMMSLLIALLLVAALALVVTGPVVSAWLADVTNTGPLVEWLWRIGRYPVLFAFVLLAFALIYYVAPSAEQKWRWVSPGSIFAGVMWLAFSMAFSVYVNNFGSYDKTYGTVGGVIVLMLYLYYSSFIVLLGAEMNQVIEEHVPGGKDEGEKTPDTA